MRALLLAALLAPGPLAAGPPVPPEYQDLHALLTRQLDSFERKLADLGPGAEPTVLATELLTANGNRGRQLLGPQALAGARLELDRLHALGVGAVTIAVPFPILYPPFLEWNGDPEDAEALMAFFTQVAAGARERGMRLIVENGVMFPGIYSSGSGMNAAGYYATLSDAQLVDGRAAMAATIAGRIRPDLLNIGSEPDTEQRLTGHSFLGTPAGFAGMIRTMVDRLASSGSLTLPVVAGAGTWTSQAGAFVAELGRIPGLWGIDLHVYPVNLDFLDRLLSLAAQAHAAGKHVTLLECWLQKERDSELTAIDSAFDPTIFARDAYSFWAPLDQRFLTLISRAAVVAGIDYVSPFWSRYFFSYLDYETVQAATPPPTASDVVALATAAHAQALTSGLSSPTGRAYAALIAGWPEDPAVEKVVPVVLDAPGANGSRFTTELTLANRAVGAGGPGPGPARVTLTYAPAGSLSGAGAGSVTTSLASGAQLVVHDVLAFLRERGLAIPEGGSQGGTLRVAFRGLASADDAYAGARTTTPSGPGRAGLAYPALTPLEARTGSSLVFGLRSSTADRSNLALANLATDAPLTLRVTLYSGAGDGRVQTLSPDLILGAGQWTQLSGVLDLAGLSNAFARVDVVSGAGPYAAYGVVNDNLTNDGSYVPSEPGFLPAETRLLPVIVESAAFRSELVLTNPTRLPQTATLTYVESTSPHGGAGGSVAVELAPSEQRILPQAVDFLRRNGATIGPMGSATYAGALSITFRSAQPVSSTPNPEVPGFAGARTVSVTGSGPLRGYGLFCSGVGAGSAALSETWIFGLVQNESSRSNLAVAAFGDSGPLVLRVDVFDGETGRLAGSTEPVDLAPGGWRQLNGILARFGVSSGYARVTRLSGSGRFLAYGVVNDGASPDHGATNDGSYISMADH